MSMPDTWTFVGSSYMTEDYNLYIQYGFKDLQVRFCFTCPSNILNLISRPESPGATLKKRFAVICDL